jgi:RNA polymerase sporulation-specific sigma factor
MKYEIDDQETIMLIRENNVEAKDIIFEKYKYIIDILINKYKRSAYVLKIDQNDLYQEAMLGFADAINTYKDDKEAKLATFITLCVERKIQNAIKKANTKKNKMFVSSISLEQQADDAFNPLIDLISDGEDSDPLVKLTNKEDYQELVNKIKEILSDSEYEVYSLMINGINYIDIANLLGKTPKQIDNAIQRIRLKIKKII